MSRKTKIDWAEATWNPVTGCLHGCPYCYARRIANRFSSKQDTAAPGALFEYDEPQGNPYPRISCGLGNRRSGDGQPQRESNPEAQVDRGHSQGLR